MSDVQETFERKVGPLPLGIWVLAVAGGVAVAVFVRRNASTADPVLVDGMPGDGSGPDLPGTTAPGAGNIYTPAPSNPYGTDLSTPGPTTNEEWARLAIQRLILKGYSPLLADTALRKYIGGSPLDTSEQAAVSEAMRLAGAPPQTLPPTYGQGPITTNPGPITPAPKPAPKPAPTPKPAPAPKPAPKPAAPKPAPVRYYVVRAGDNLTSIGRKYGRSWQQLYAANRALIGPNPNLIHPGQKLRIP